MKKIIKIIFWVVFVLAICLYVFFVKITAPKSDISILKAYEGSLIQPVLTEEKFKQFKYRKITIQSDTLLPTIVFVHGTVGSINDFSKYLSDSILQKKANMIAYDRIGYNYKDNNPTQESIVLERLHLESVIEDIPAHKVVLFGYSYGGPIVLSIQKKVRQIFLIAPAVYSKVEPMPWLINLYKFKGTRWLLPKVWKEASKEKLSHKKDLLNFEENWNTSPNKIIAIHGIKDWIVPISNSRFLEQIFTAEQFKLITISGVGHELVWTKFDQIQQELTRFLNQIPTDDFSKN